MTLALAAHHPSDSLTEALSSVSVPLRAHEVITGVELIESRLTKTGAIHQTLHTAYL